MVWCYGILSMWNRLSTVLSIGMIRCIISSVFSIWTLVISCVTDGQIHWGGMLILSGYYIVFSFRLIKAWLTWDPSPACMSSPLAVVSGDDVWKTPRSEGRPRWPGTSADHGPQSKRTHMDLNDYSSTERLNTESVVWSSIGMMENVLKSFTGVNYIQTLLIKINTNTEARATLYSVCCCCV